MKEDVFLALSGGMDSASLLMRCIDLKKDRNYRNEIFPIFIDYNQKPRLKELEAANAISNLLLNKNVITIQFPCLENRSDHMETISKDPAKTVYPFRNAIIYSYLVYHAARYGVVRDGMVPVVMLGVHKGDITDYPDTREGFIMVMSKAVEEGTEGSVLLQAPFLFYKKYQIIQNVHTLPKWKEVMQLTSSCYHAAYDIPVCGECPSCLFRAEAFKQADIKDPLLEV